MDILRQPQPISGQHYSGVNRVPDIQTVVDKLDHNKKSRDAAIDANASGRGDSVEHRDAQKRGAHHARVVRDPVTGRDVEIADAEMDYKSAVDNPMISVPNENLGKPTTVPVSSNLDYRKAQDLAAPPAPAPGSTSDVPIRSEKTSITFYRTPGVHFESMYGYLEQRGNVLCAGIFFAIVVFGRAMGGSLYGLVPLAICVASAVFLWIQDIVKQGRDLVWASEQDRGESATANLIPESVEWINTALAVFWGMINPEMFAAVADTLEDVMAASVPGIIENVRVADISQGNNPIRILNMRALPDSQVEDIKHEIHKNNAKNMDTNELAATEQAGAFYNLEVSIGYHAKPSTDDISSKAKNMGMLLVFYLGVKGLFGIPLPIWVELLGLVATARVRLQLTPEPPFLKTLTFTLMGKPKVQAGCTPMLKGGINILNLPLISNFVNWAIGAAASMYVAPKSLTIDMRDILQGDDIKKEVFALGILYIRIHKATNLSKQDLRGSKGGGSDPYVTVSWSKFSKPQFCTRVIQDCLNPIFEESCGLPVTAEIIKADEQVLIELWDSDRSSADDVVGKVELSVQKLIQHPGKMFPQVSKLRGLKPESAMPGELHWEIGFFGRTEIREALRTDGKTTDVPEELQDKKELQDDKGAINDSHEDAVVHTPPDPLWPSGVLSIVVHQIVGLEFANIKGTTGKRQGREFEPARPEAGDVKEQESKKLPSSYCTILVNDELVYKTRTKVVSSQPIFNAGLERFVRDWRSSLVTVSVRDSRNRQHDPLIGVVSLKLSDVLTKGSQSTKWYTLDGGIGFGRIRVSLLFRSVELSLPRPLLGWDVGTFEFLSDRLSSVSYGASSGMKIRLRTGGSSAVIPKSAWSSSEDGSGAAWDISGQNGFEQVRLPVLYRYRSPIFFEFCESGKSKPGAYASIWLQDIIDLDPKDYDIPIWKCDRSMWLSQNYITSENYKMVPGISLEEVGRLRFRGQFSAGFCRDHLKFITDNDSRESLETWEACLAEGLRGEAVKVEVPPETQQKHDESLQQKADDEWAQQKHDESLPQTGDAFPTTVENERQQWVAKDGTDWSSAFGHDPSALASRKAQGSHEDHDQSAPGSDIDDDGSDDDASDSSNPDLGIRDATTSPPPEEDNPAAEAADAGDSGSLGTSKKSGSKNPLKAYRNYRERSRDLHRTHRGLMQWRPMRNVQFAKDEAKFALRKVGTMGSLKGRKPDVETEI